MILEKDAKTVDTHLANLRDLARELAEAATFKLQAELRYTERLRAYEVEEHALRKLLNVYRGGTQEKRQPPALCARCGHAAHQRLCAEQIADLALGHLCQCGA